VKKWAVITMLMATPAFGDSSSLNLQIPTGPTSYQSDSFRAGDLDCKNAIGGGVNLEFGVTGVINNVGGSYSTMNNYFNDQSKDVGVYARIVIPLDKPRERINCNTLYQLELQQRRLEIQKLQAEIQQLRALQDGADFEN
jgi:hypothetical protein